MLKAGSLFYALILMLLIGVVLSVLILNSSTDKLIKTKLELENELIDFNGSSIAYALANYTKLDSTEQIEKPFSNAFKFSVKKEKWGFLDLLYCNSFYRKDTIKKIAIIGSNKTDKLALYLADFNKPLYLLNTKIKGDCKLPRVGISRLHINNRQYKKNVILGNISNSKKELPKINKAYQIPSYSSDKIAYKDIKHNSKLINKFNQPTKVIYLDKSIDIKNIEISGKFILKSFDSICIKKTAILNDVIIQSPKIYIENGFKGNVQLFATKQIQIGENVTLELPSILHLMNETRDDVKIDIGENSKLYGNILFYGKTEHITTNYLSINKNARIIGTIYCQGTTELKGKIYGTIYTNKFKLDTGDSKYDNAIKDGEINVLDLPKDFVTINLEIENENEKNHAILKWLP